VRIVRSHTLTGITGVTLDQSASFRMLGAEPMPRQVGGEPSVVTVNDCVYNRYATANTFADYQLRPWVSPDADAPTYESLTPSVASVSAFGKLTHLTDGVASVRCTIGGIARTKKLVLETRVTPDADTWTGFASGSLAHHFAQQIDSRLAGKSAATALRVFSTQIHDSATYVRNTSFWAADKVASLLAVSPWNSRGGAARAGVAITRRHLTQAQHYWLTVNDTVRFVLADNSVITRTVVGAAFAPGSGDTRILTLDTDLPESMPIPKVLPDDIADYLPSLSPTIRIPCIYFDQEEKGLVHDIRALTPSVSNTRPTDTKRAEFYEPLVGGDSGNICGNWVGDDFVIFSTGAWTVFGAPSSAFNARLNAGIALADAQAGVSTGYTVTPVDLSAFPAY